MNLRNELLKAVGDEVYDQTEEGIFFPRQGVIAKGEYFGSQNGEQMRLEGFNLLTTEGILFALDVAFGSAAKASGIYLALFTGSTAPAYNWTAANFAAVASENTSLTEGYTNATRPAFTPGAAAGTSGAGSIDNLAGEAQVTFATTSEVTITGAALLTNSVRGGTTGKLLSAVKYPTARVFQNTDTYGIGYRVSLSN